MCAIESKAANPVRLYTREDSIAPRDGSRRRCTGMRGNVYVRRQTGTSYVSELRSTYVPRIVVCSGLRTFAATLDRTRRHASRASHRVSRRDCKSKTLAQRLEGYMPAGYCSLSLTRGTVAIRMLPPRAPPARPDGPCMGPGECGCSPAASCASINSRDIWAHSGGMRSGSGAADERSAAACGGQAAEAEGELGAPPVSELCGSM